MDIKDFTDTSNLTFELRLQDLKQAARDGLITEQQAQALWQRWSQGQHWQATRPVDPNAPQPAVAAIATGPRFSFVNVLYYFGGLLAIGAMTLFMTL
ncbi:MAG: DUF2157 domain-containing protein, partial [Betaproteobacteria bacterium]|nr:DUF2157 domain-containing protein [Betaproteobacteria bacterium]